VFTEYERMRENMVAPLRRHLIGLMGVDKSIESLAEMGATNKTIGRIVNKDNSTIGKRLKRMRMEEMEKTHS